MASLDEFAREEAILLELNSSGRVVVNDLAAEFGVSTVTVRKDLEALEKRGMLRRVRGGAVSHGSGEEGAFDMRLRRSRESKRAVAKLVSPLVGRGDVIALDASTTCYYLGQELLERRDLVVVTNGMRLAVMLMEQSSATVLMPGGALRRASASMVGPIGDVLAGRGRIDRGFFGVAGVSTAHGLLDLSGEEAMTKQFMAASCNQIYGIFDSSKVGGFGLHSFAPVERITALFTDDGVEAAVISQWESLGVPLHTTPVARAATTDQRGTRTHQR